jgi:multicomponent K+:H+ antiporter subunit E
MLRRLFPHPMMSLALILTWMLLVNEAKLGSLVMAAILGTIIPLIIAPYWPGARLRIRLLPLLSYVLLVIWDIIVANVHVARIVVFTPASKIRSSWVAVPLDLKSPEAITLLAGTVTMTPGTLSADISACGTVLLVHALHTTDPDAVRDDIKTRYEARLKRIFEC